MKLKLALFIPLVFCFTLFFGLSCFAFDNVNEVPSDILYEYYYVEGASSNTSGTYFYLTPYGLYYSNTLFNSATYSHLKYEGNLYTFNLNGSVVYLLYQGSLNRLYWLISSDNISYVKNSTISGVSVPVVTISRYTQLSYYNDSSMGDLFNKYDHDNPKPDEPDDPTPEEPDNPDQPDVSGDDPLPDDPDNPDQPDVSGDDPLPDNPNPPSSSVDYSEQLDLIASDLESIRDYLNIILGVILLYITYLFVKRISNFIFDKWRF